MKLLRRITRLLVIVVLVLAGLLIAALRLRHPPDRPLSAAQQRIVSRWMGAMCQVLGIRVRTRGEPPQGTHLVVSNHISWLDILVLGSVLPVAFVSKAEIARWPVIGWLARRTGTLFIQRGGKNAANEMTTQMTERLRQGGSIALFPEGTTTDGHRVRRFHPRLFGAAIQAQVPVQPVAIRYPHEDGVHPAAPFIDDEHFMRNGWRVLGEPVVDADVIFCRPVRDSESDRSALANRARQCIEAVVLARSEIDGDP